MVCTRSVHIYFIISLCSSMVMAAAGNDKCERCMPIADCPLFREMSEQQQKKSVVNFLCQNPSSEGSPPQIPTGAGAAAGGQRDYVCCPEENVWGFDNTQNTEIGGNAYTPDGHQQYDEGDINNNDDTNIPQYDQNEHSAQSFDDQNYQDSDFDNKDGSHGGDSYEQSRLPNRRRRPLHPRPRPRPHLPGPHTYTTRPGNNRNPPRNPTLMTHVNAPNFNNPTGNFPNFNGPNNNFPNFNGPSGDVPNYNGPNSNINNQERYHGNGNTFGGEAGAGAGAQCAAGAGVTSAPPAPGSGCCGRHATADKLLSYPQNTYLNRPAPNQNQNVWSRPLQQPPQYNPWSPNNGRYQRSAQNDTADISLDNRIAGGKETELEQFPWTVLLKTTFDYGDKKASFSCGGSIISARYILTAAHCVSEPGARVSEIEINLAEYDKRTFPRDCVATGAGRRCVDNVLMQAEDATPHPEYDDKRLQNDIALIRMRGTAPYTDFIRPICLPPIDIDTPQYSDLRLAVAGWGRDGEHVSAVKQSAVVNLVPQRACAAAYPRLTRRHVCAGGRGGQDTCKGDSGGPLMMLYEGRYYVSGVVSGKRADAPCGTAGVPSLYTNVFHYLDWIRHNIRN